MSGKIRQPPQDRVPSVRMARVFVAVDLPEGVERALGEAARSLREARIEGLRPVRQEGVHLTLKFLGDVPESRLDEVARAVSDPVAGHRPFDISTGNFGAFPNARRPMVLWVGIGGGVEPLLRLQEDIDAALGVLGFPTETRPYHPHLTLARLGYGMSARARRESVDALESTGLAYGMRIPVGSVSLVESILGHGGARYVRLATARLAEVHR